MSGVFRLRYFGKAEIITANIIKINDERWSHLRILSLQFVEVWMSLIFARSYRRMLVLMASLLLIPISGFALDAPASLVPAGVSPGSQFYLIFTTSGVY